ncbi:Cro/Cl family transcriptional regulator [Lactobacillus paraplantarum] [Lactiplantibacillus mudanjiangensis]|nr:Cro/Cl family transcriptional regulator [Lactobacillus paraplantarum] [Lactiplantibacillus mudanjiangensis]
MIQGCYAALRLLKRLVTIHWATNQKYRVRHDWSQRVLTPKLNVTRQTISKWELDKSYPDLESLIRLSDLFAVSTNFCLTLVKQNASD